MTKVHLPHPTDSAKPLCGRQVFNHRSQVSQDQDGIAIADDPSDFTQALAALRPKACRHCARLAGYLPPLERRERTLDPEIETEAKSQDSWDAEVEGELDDEQ